MWGDNIQSFYTNWEDNHGDHLHGHVTTFEGRSNYEGSASSFDQTDSNNISLHLHSQGGSPLGLSLRKSNSLLNLVEKRLSQEREQKKVESPPTREKLKASNFHARLLQIGSWKRISKNEGDLVAKVYYAKKKLVWEFLNGPLKSKIEIQWSEIAAIRAFTHEGEYGHLEIELNQPPQFGREINPQPRKHTQWKQTTDFTGGQASICRRHVVIFPPGVLDRQYEKLLQCDDRLFNLSQQPFPVNNYPYFNYDPNHCLSYSNTNVHHRQSDQLFGNDDLNWPISATRQVNENQQKGNIQFEGIPAISIGVQDHFQPCYGQGSWIPVQQSQTKTLNEEIESTGYGNSEITSIDHLRVNSGFGHPDFNSWEGVPNLYGLQCEQGINDLGGCYNNQHYNTNWT